MKKSKNQRADIVVRSLISGASKYNFGYPGGYMPVYDALYDYHDQVRHFSLTRA